MKKLLQLLILIHPVFLFAQSYNVSLIPDSLREKANAVKRFEELRVIIKSPSKAVIKRKFAITIFNEEGQKYSGHSTTYSKMFSLNSLDGNLYDAAGKQIKSVKKKDIADLAYNDQMTFVSDDRLKSHNFYYRSFPYTVEYEEENEYEGIFFLPRWQPVLSQFLSVQNSNYIIETPADYELRYKCLNTAKPEIINSPKGNTYKWSLANYKAIKNEPFQPNFDEITPVVYIAPNDFEFGGFKGNMSSWESLGKYLSQLYSNRDQLPENLKQQIHSLVDNVADKKEKVRLLYEYMQQNTRYIGIQLGIGGWQPFDATYVASKRYGDCKALSNFMVSMLKEAGIKANPVIINSGDGERGLWEDFPAPFFNHVVMCVPDAKDTLWLECTSQTRSAGYMGSSTGNRKALMLTEEGGKVINTPRYTKNDNLQLRKINAIVNDEGTLIAEVQTRFTGQQQELQHSLIHEATAEQRQRYLNEAISLATYNVDRSEYKEHKGKLPAIDEYLKITASNYAAVSGKRLFIVPNLFNRGGSKLSTDEPRKFDIKFDFPYQDVDTISIKIPAGYEAEALPKDVSLQTKFGNYSINFKVNGSSIDVLRISERYAGLYPASEYLTVAKFLEEIYKADRSKIVLIKKETLP